MAYLEVTNLRKSFGKTEVLRGIDFSMERGKVVAVIGASGGGKTTFLRCLNFLERADLGDILINDERDRLAFTATAKYSDRQIRQMRLSFGLVFQSFNLFPQYTALKNVLLPMNLRAAEAIRKNKGLSFSQRRAAKRAAYAENEIRAKELLTEVGLADKMGHYPCELSGGQQQRVAIARALAQSPAILCFDEPTSALDPLLTAEVLHVIRELKEAGHTMIVVTHEMKFAREVADRVVFFADGNIEEQGSPEEVFDRPKSEKTRAFFAQSLE